MLIRADGQPWIYLVIVVVASCEGCNSVGGKKGKGSSQNLPKTCWICVKCNKPLCQKEKRNCFVEFHSP